MLSKSGSMTSSSSASLAATTVTMIGNGESNTGSTKKKKSSSMTSLIRSVLIDLPIVLLFALLLSTLLLQHVYSTLLTPLINSYKRQSLDDDFYDEFRGEFTYYNRHCDKRDISTTSSNDLLVHPDDSPTQAADIMLRHGAAAISNLIRNDTAIELRKYLSAKHTVRHTLPWNEVFWDGEDGTRLSLGIGTSDAPVITDALQQIGSHPVLKRTLQGILGDDPAIVEINTLTALYGAHDQGIHTDSDWFGSSLLYSRTFLHSYTMFVALQDTPESMGATTVCPGSHYCADQDFDSVCLEHGAFSVSTNGETGRHGMLRRGDGFLFNQNIWHRGPRNVHPSRQDRVMLALTFVSRNKQHAPGEYRRRQGLGTYYYQRWDMWAATFEYLKDAGTAMIQPWSALRALGLYVPTARNIGILWIEQFAQQIANADDFYDDFELQDFKTRLWEKRLKLPIELRSSAEQWEEFIPETMDIWRLVVVKVYTAALLVGLVVSLLVDGRSFWKRFVLTHGFVCVIVYACWMYIEQTDTARTIKSGDVFLRPFPEPPTLNDLGLAVSDHPTTFPERHDILIGTRFDAEFLASFNRFLEFHPGNQEWRAKVADVASLPVDCQEAAAHRVVHNMLATKKEGLPTRFLLQDPNTGAWRIMKRQEAADETWHAALSETKPLVGYLAAHMKNRLAASRFGAGRDTVMARKFGVSFATKWLSTLFGRTSGSMDRKSLSHYCRPPHNGSRSGTRKVVLTPSLLPRVHVDPSTFTAVVPSTITRNSIPNALSNTERAVDDAFRPGDRVWADYDGTWYEATLLGESSDGVWTYEFALSGYDDGEFRAYNTIQEGDSVNVEFDGEFTSGTLLFVHPDGRCSVRLGDGEIVDRVPREDIWLIVDEEE